LSFYFFDFAVTYTMLPKSKTYCCSAFSAISWISSEKPFSIGHASRSHMDATPVVQAVSEQTSEQHECVLQIREEVTTSKPEGSENSEDFK
jgi:hypothetical protein